MGSKVKRKKMLLARDEYKCGTHTGGCGQILDPNIDEIDIDHMIPRSFLGEANAASAFYKHNFLQPMHRRCNADLKKGQVSGYPRFRCTCHHGHMDVDNNCYKIYYKTTGSWKSEIFSLSLVAKEREDKSKNSVSFTLKAGKSRKGDSVGWSAGQFGHIVSQIPYEKRAECFLRNAQEALRCRRRAFAEKELQAYISHESVSHSEAALAKKCLIDIAVEKNDTEIDRISLDIEKICNPENYYIQLGMRCDPSKNVKDAKENFSKAVGINPNNEISRNGLGYCLFLMEKYAEAELHFLAALKKNSKYDLAINNLVLCYVGWAIDEYGIDNRKVALSKLSAALSIECKNMQVIGEVGCAYSLMEDSEGAQKCEECMQKIDSNIVPDFSNFKMFKVEKLDA